MDDFIMVYIYIYTHKKKMIFRNYVVTPQQDLLDRGIS